MKKLLAILATTALVSLTAPALAQEKTDVTISQAFQSLLYLPLYVAIDDGMFDDAGLNVTKESAGSGPTALNSVISGSADFSLHGPEWTAIAFEKGAPVKTIANVVNGAAVWILADEDFDYKGPESFSGQTVVAGMMPTTSTSLFLKLLSEKGVDKDSVKTIQVQIGAEPAPFIGGQAPLAVMYEPGVDQAVAEGKKVILSFPKEYGPYAFSTIMARSDVDEDKATKFVAGLQKALETIQKDPAEAVKVAQKEFPNLDPKVVEAAVKRMIDDGVYAPSVDITKEAMETSLGVQIALGNLGSQPDFSKFVDKTFIDKAMGE
ncbi:ABC transporter substrate-binding protein [Jiella endophytica]|uniref:ABC transporter substrate-binding protein n=1 Tax=Jiella endophytica TaxID=2558362 RepID=A0A4Y8RUE4_9HYPH|nr:ABC transporter substrate-binding protein [Jiella endophytica]TFF27382.1 ABC transporter substrate-binding protein [Jiella endophytica]